MRAYHGTIAPEIQVLQPFASPHSNLDYPCVYLSTNKALAAIYIWNKAYKWMTFEIRDDGMPVYFETFPNALYEFYNGVKGYIYTCDESFDSDSNTKIRCAVVSKKPVPVVSVEVVDNAYERLLEYEKKGLLVIHRFETLSEERRKSDRNMVLGTIKNLNLLSGNHPLSDFVKEKFPEHWAEALENQK